MQRWDVLTPQGKKIEALDDACKAFLHINFGIVSVLGVRKFDIAMDLFVGSGKFLSAGNARRIGIGENRHAPHDGGKGDDWQSFHPEAGPYRAFVKKHGGPRRLETFRKAHMRLGRREP